MGKKGDFSYFDHNMSVCARHAHLNISETAELLRFYHTTTKTENIQWAGILFAKNASVIPEVRGKLPDCFELTERQQLLK